MRLFSPLESKLDMIGWLFLVRLDRDQPIKSSYLNGMKQRNTEDHELGGYYV